MVITVFHVTPKSLKQEASNAHPKIKVRYHKLHVIQKKMLDTNQNQVRFQLI